MRSEIQIEQFTENNRHVRSRWISDGHDCWGRGEGYHEYYVLIGTGKERTEERVGTDMYIISWGNEVLCVAYNWNLESEINSALRVIADRRQYKLEL